ncbi:MAG TPA: hypothetical protein VJ761_05380 [Ktedonobacteraceae bacterium]|nr:hypothetical protein [Ktedonobacteraceae bacterium]
MSNQRDTHFAGYAERLYPDLKKLFTAYYERKFFEDEQGMEQIVGQIKMLLAQSAYDLACHTASFMTVPEVRKMCAGMLSPGQAIEHIPDLTAGPEEHEAE